MTKFPFATMSVGGSPQQPLTKNSSGLGPGSDSFTLRRYRKWGNVRVLE